MSSWSAFEGLLAGQYDSSVKGIRKSAMTTPNHHQANDDFAKSAKHAAQRCADCWVAKAEADVATVQEITC